MKFSKKQLAIIGGCACLGVLIVGGAYYIATTQNAPSFKLEKAKPSQDTDTPKQVNRHLAKKSIMTTQQNKQNQHLKATKKSLKKTSTLLNQDCICLDAIKNSENTEPSYGNFYGITTTR